MTNLSEPQPPPVVNERRRSWSFVIGRVVAREVGGSICSLLVADMRERDRRGSLKYGTPLQSHNGRDSLVDAYQESLDLCVYLHNDLVERAEEEGAIYDYSLLDDALQIAARIRRRIFDRGER